MTRPAVRGAGPVAVAAVATAGTAARLVQIHAAIRPPGTDTALTGLPDAIASTVLDRIRAAFVGSGLNWPRPGVLLEVTPPQPAADSGLDVAFAVAILAVTGQISRPPLAGRAFVGELDLDGRLRPLPDTLERVRVAAQAGFTHVVVPAANLTDLGAVDATTVGAAATLHRLVDGLRGRLALQPDPAGQPPDWPDLDMADLPAAHPGRRILTIAAAGGHHLAMFGPQSAATMLARRLLGLLPDLDTATAAEVEQLYRAAEQPRDDATVRVRPPWQAPHPNISIAALIGSPRRPGAVSLAHGGVLFCDDAGALPATAAGALRTMLDERRVTLDPGRIVYPARIQLVLASTGCPQTPDCTCAPGGHRRYLTRLFPLLDRIDIQVSLPSAMPDRTGLQPEMASAQLAQRVAGARAVAAARWGGPGCTNAEATAEALQASLAGAATQPFDLLTDRVTASALSTRGAAGVLRLAWTIADLAEHRHPTSDDVAEAIRLRTRPDFGRR